MGPSVAGLALDILKVESWTQMGRTANIIIKYSIHVFASICKNRRILLMGRRYRERWVGISSQRSKAPQHFFFSLEGQLQFSNAINKQFIQFALGPMVSSTRAFLKVPMAFSGFLGGGLLKPCLSIFQLLLKTGNNKASKCQLKLQSSQKKSKLSTGEKLQNLEELPIDMGNPY